MPNDSSDSPDDHFLRLGPGDDEAADEDVVARLHIEPGGNVQERGLGDNVESKDRAETVRAAAHGRAI